MNKPATTQDRYAEEIVRWTQAMALAQNDAVYDAISPDSQAFQVDMFTDGNVEKRFEKVEKQVQFLAPAFENLQELVEKYILEIPLAAYDTGLTDGDKFLQFLEKAQPLNAEQKDFIACQRARYGIEDVARQNRVAHIRFQELWSVAGELAEDLESNHDLLLHLNPIRVWTKFHTRQFLDEDAKLPADVLFFPVKTEISTALLDPNGKKLIHELETFEPCTADDWSPLSQRAERSELVDLCRDLAGMGLVAFS